MTTTDNDATGSATPSAGDTTAEFCEARRDTTGPNPNVGPMYPSPTCAECGQPWPVSAASTPSADSGPGGERDAWIGEVWRQDAADGWCWKCPDCESWASLGGNAGFHAQQTGHGRPSMQPINTPPAGEPAPAIGDEYVIVQDGNKRWVERAAGEPAPGGEAVLWTGMLPLIGYHRVRSLGSILADDPQSHETFAVEWDTDDGWEDSDYKEELCGHLVKLLRAAKG